MGQKYTEKKKKYWRKKATRATPFMLPNKETLWQTIKGTIITILKLIFKK